MAFLSRTHNNKWARPAEEETSRRCVPTPAIYRHYLNSRGQQSFSFYYPWARHKHLEPRLWEKIQEQSHVLRPSAERSEHNEPNQGCRFVTAYPRGNAPRRLEHAVAVHIAGGRIDGLARGSHDLVQDLTRRLLQKRLYEIHFEL